jgi:O-acetylhomoserine/O-acetylserine sulfhydrylase-like pyridoxal-dependent enzyme
MSVPVPNPAQSVLGKRLASLEGGETALAVASGIGRGYAPVCVLWMHYNWRSAP